MKHSATSLADIPNIEIAFGTSSYLDFNPTKSLGCVIFRTKKIQEGLFMSLLGEVPHLAKLLGFCRFTRFYGRYGGYDDDS